MKNSHQNFIRITKHALARYLERVLGYKRYPNMDDQDFVEYVSVKLRVSIGTIEEMMLDKVNRKVLTRFGDGNYDAMCGDSSQYYTIIVRDSHVVTILDKSTALY